MHENLINKRSIVRHAVSLIERQPLSAVQPDRYGETWGILMDLYLWLVVKAPRGTN